MQIPAYLITGLQNFLRQLDQLMLTAGCPTPVHNDVLIEKFSDNPDFCSLQHSYSLIWVIVEKILPIIRRDANGLIEKGKQAAAILDAALTFKLKAHIDALEISGQWSYYAACEFTITMQELGTRFNNAPDDDTVTKDIRDLFKTFSFDPNQLVEQLAEKLGKNISVQRDYENLRDRFTTLEKSLVTTETDIASLPVIGSYQPDLSNAEEAKNPASNYLNQCQKTLTEIENTITQLATSLDQLVPLIKVLPKQMLLLNGEKKHDFENAPVLGPASDLVAKLQTLIKEKQATLAKVAENQHYFKKVYDDIVAHIGSIKEAIAKLPLQIYSVNEHKEYLAALLALKVIDFSAIAQEKLPRPECAKESANIQQAFSKLIEQQKETLTKEISAKQKQCFSAQLKQALENAFTRARDEKLADPGLKSELIENAKGNETELDKLQTFYSYCDNWLKGQLSYHNLKQMAEGWVKDTLQNDDAAQQLLREFTSEDYKLLSESIKKLAEPLEKVIADGQLKLDMANTAKIDRLKIEVSHQEQRIVEYTAALKQANEAAQKLSEKHQLDCQTTQSKLDEINKQITELLTKRTKLTDQLNITPISSGSSSELLQRLKSDEIYQPINQQITPLQEKLIALTTTSNTIGPQLKQAKANKETIAALQTNTIKTFDDFPLSGGESNRNKLSTLIGQLEKTKDLWSPENTPYEKIHGDLTKEKNSNFPGHPLHIMLALKKDCTTLLAQQIESLESKIQPLLEESKKTNSEAESTEKKLTSHHETFSQLKTIDHTLCNQIGEAQKNEKYLQDLRTAQGQALSDLYKGLSVYLPKETVVTQGEESKTHQNNINSMNCELNLTKAKIALIEFKKPAVEQQANLNKIQQDLGSLQINPAAFQYKPDSPASFNDQWQAHTQQINQAIATSRQSITAIDEQLKKINKDDTTLAKQLNAITQILKQTAQDIQTSKIPEPSGLPPLINAKDHAHQELLGFKERTYQMRNLRSKKAIALQVQQNIYDRETRVAQTHQTNLLAAEQCKTNITTQTNLFTPPQHQYDANTITDLTQRRKPADFILQEDQFYLDRQTQCTALQAEIDRLKTLLVSNKPSGLDQAFNQKLNAKINECQTQLATLNQTRTTQAQAWQDLSRDNLVIQHSRQVLKDQNPPPPPNRNYTGHDLRGIQLANGSFAGIPIQNANLSYATLTNFTFDGPLSGVNLSHANVSTCTFTAQANFQGVLLNAQTQLDWQTYGEKIWRDNQVANPYATNVNDATQATYLTNLITLVSTKCNNQPNKLIELTRNTLQAIAAIPKPNNSSEEDHLNALQQRAVWFMQKMVPLLSFKDLIELGHELATTKHDDDANPYGFIRRELDTLRCKYGNTRPWEQIMTPIKERLHSLATQIANTPAQDEEGEAVIVQENQNPVQPQEHQKISSDDYTKFMTIMRSQTVHTYGFGKIAFFFTPAHNFEQHWEQREHDLLVQPQQNNNQIQPEQ